MVIDVGSRLIYHSERAPTTELDTSVEVIVNLVGTASNEREGQVLVFGLAGSNILQTSEKATTSGRDTLRR